LQDRSREVVNERGRKGGQDLKIGSIGLSEHRKHGAVGGKRGCGSLESMRVRGCCRKSVGFQLMNSIFSAGWKLRSSSAWGEEDRKLEVSRELRRLKTAS
jgi:hypothetical protein